MPSPDAHLAQANSNLRFVSHLSLGGQFFDWQATGLFYAAMHLMDAHLAKNGQFYGNHQERNRALSNHNLFSPARLPQPIYDDFMSLMNLSWRARYLKGSPVAEKHVAEGFHWLENVAQFFEKTHGINLPPVAIACSRIRKGELPHFSV